MSAGNDWLAPSHLVDGATYGIEGTLSAHSLDAGDVHREPIGLAEVIGRLQQLQESEREWRADQNRPVGAYRLVVKRTEASEGSPIGDGEVAVVVVL